MAGFPVEAPTANPAAFAALQAAVTPYVIYPALIADGVTDDTAALQAAINSASAKGALIQLPAGTILISASITIPSRMTIAGLGGQESLGNPVTRVVINSATLDAFVVNASGVSFRDLMVQNILGLNGQHMSTNGLFRIYNTTQVPTAGAGIHYQNLNSGVVNPQAGDYTSLTRVTVQGFYTNVQYDSGFYYNLEGCFLLDPVYAGLSCQNLSADGGDHSDQSISACVISIAQSSRTPFAAIYWTVGGGLRCVGNKINAREQPTFPPSYTGQTGGSGQVIGSPGTFQFGINAPIASDTSVLLITGNSIENCTSMSVLVTNGPNENTSTKTFGNITIVGNEFLFLGIKIGPAGASSPAKFNNVTIVGNVFANQASAATYDVNLLNIDNVTVTGNVFTGAGINLGGFLGCTYSVTQPNTYYNDNCPILTLSTATQNALGGSAAELKRTYTREVPTYTANTAKRLYKISIPAFNAGIIDITVAGNLFSIGAVVSRASFYYTRGGSGNVTLTQIGTTAGVDALAVTTGTTGTGTNYTLIVDPASSAGDVLIAWLTSKTSFIGSVSVEVTGGISLVRKGT